MKKSKQDRVAELLAAPYARILVPDEEGGYSAEVLEFPGCFAEGDTAEEAVENLERAAESWLIACVERGIDVPKPLTNYEASGKFALRLPRTLYARATKAAAREGVSLNQFISAAVAERLGYADCMSHLEAKVAERIECRVRAALDLESQQAATGVDALSLLGVTFGDRAVNDGTRIH